MIEALAESHAALALRLRMIVAAKLRDARGHMTLLGRKTAMEKIASFLVEMDHRSTPIGGRFVELPMNRGILPRDICGTALRSRAFADFSSGGNGAVICPAFLARSWTAGLDEVRGARG